MKTLLIITLFIFLSLAYSGLALAAGQTTWYLAEGCTSGDFSTWILIQNPNTNTSAVTITFMDQDSNTQQLSEVIPGNSRSSYNVNNYLPNKDVSTKITSDVGVIAERAMYWSAGGEAMAGGHCSIGSSTTATTWYLAEGCTSGDFSTWVLIQNPGETTASCTITFMNDTGKTHELTDTIPPNSRRSYDVNNYMANSNVSTRIVSSDSVGIIAERAMYWSAGGVASAGGHCSLGVTAASTSWYLAEGCTSGDFSTWVLIQNPNENDSAVTITFMDQDANTHQFTDTVDANSRSSYCVNNYMDDKDVSTKVTGDVGIIVERAMYWTAGGIPNAGGHCSLGASSTETTWFLAEGCTNGYDEYVLIQNPSGSSAASCTLTFMDENGTTQQVTDSVPANSRRSYNVNSYMPDASVSTKVECTNELGIVTERAMYWSGADGIWKDGHASIGVLENTSEGGPGGGDGGGGDGDGDDGGGGEGSNPEEEAYLLWHVDTEPINASSPAIGSDGTIYIGTDGDVEWGSGQTAKVYAVNSSGTTLWTYTVGQDKPVAGAIAIDANGHLYFVVDHFLDGNENSDVNTYLYSITSSGSERWISGVLYNGNKDGGPENPAIAADGTIYVTTHHYLHAYNANGTSKWTAPYPFYNPERPNDEFGWSISSPTVDSDGVIYVNVTGDPNHSIYGIYAIIDSGTSGTLKWRQYADLEGTQTGDSSPSLDESRGRLYAGRGGVFTANEADSYVYCLNMSDGSFVWKIATANKKVQAQPVIDSDGTIYVGTTAKPRNSVAGVFFAINPDGTLKWSYDTMQDINSNADIYSTATIGDNGTIYFSLEGRYIYAFNPDGTLVKKYDLFVIVPSAYGSASIVSSSIAIGSDGTLYCGDFYHSFDNDDPSNVTHTGALYAFDSDCTGLANTEWPKIQNNISNTGRK